jgi:nucleotide-binding universal stress UspA family protein
MPLLSNILLALEDVESPAPIGMLQTLLNLSGSRGAKITLLHVVKGIPSAEKYGVAMARGNALLANTVAQLALPPEYECKTILRTGDPKDTVCQVAEEINASILLMGSRGLNNVIAILKSSVSQYVFQRASCPMILIRDGVYVNRLNRIAVAVSDSMSSKFALKTASDLVKQIPGGMLLLIRVSTKTIDATKSMRPEDQSLILATAAEFARSQGVEYKSLYGQGSPGPEICRLAEENGADLLVLGCADRRPSIAMNLPDLDRLLGNSVSDYVRTQSNCPVLLQKTLD